MTSTHASSFSSFLIDLNQDHDCQQLLSYSEITAEAAVLSSSSSSSACPILVNPPLEGRGHYEGNLQRLQNQHEVNLYGAHGGSKDQGPVTMNGREFTGVESFVSNKEDRKEIHSEKGLDKWMSSKMRLMKKMMISDQTVADTPETSLKKFEDQTVLVSSSQIDNNCSFGFSNSSSTIRVCADCNTTKTPLWRSGPRGPKSLCNACGIRQRKARRAMAEATSAANGTTVVSAVMPKVKTKAQHREKKTSNSHLPFKKRCKFTAQARGRKKLCFEDLTILLNKNTALHQQVFPQDEKEAAILLMALSYGLVHG